jgi:hypothetical protein
LNASGDLGGWLANVEIASVRCGTGWDPLVIGWDPLVIGWDPLVIGWGALVIG